MSININLQLFLTLSSFIHYFTISKMNTSNPTRADPLNTLSYSSQFSNSNDGYALINGVPAKVTSYVNPSEGLPQNKKPNYEDQTYFRWESPLQTAENKNFEQATKNQLEKLHNLFKNNDNQNILRDPNGALIINADDNKIWFSKNVAFIFGIGAIYDEEDDKIMNNVMAYFNNNHENAFLMNHHRVEGYLESKLIQEIERKLKLDNGNYHVFLVPIVYTSDPKILSQSPEPKYSVSGIVDKYMKWQTITNYLREVIAKYGLITNLDRPHDPNSWEIGQDGLATKRSLHNDVECKFNIEIDPEQHDTPIQKDLEFKETLNKDFNSRIHKDKVSRLNQYLTGPTGRSKRMKLYTQMNGGIVDNELTSATLFDPNLGVELRLNEKYHPEQKKYVEYQIYDDDSTYVNGQNIVEQTNVTPKIDMPKFPLTTLHGANARTPTVGNCGVASILNKNNTGNNLDIGHMASRAVRNANRARQQGAHTKAINQSV